MLEEKLVEYLDKFEAIIKTYSPTVVETGYAFLYAEMVFNILTCLIMLVVLLRVVPACFRKAGNIVSYRDINDEKERARLEKMYRANLEIAYAIAGVIIGFICIISLFVGMRPTFYSIIGLFDPNIYLIYKLMS